MTLFLEWLATTSAAFFAGAALYISIVEHPARMQAGAAVALAEFRPSYRRAAPVQASSAALSLLAGVLASFTSSEWIWAIGGLLVGAAIPFTLVAILPINRRLLDTSAALSEHAAETLLTQWGRLHWVRGILGTAGFLVLLSGLFLR